ncbi:MAG: ABC transporter permease, partial [Myxococcota bacterium]|nr:ABC transporter permease [Myxococcota bacterium]
MSAKARVIQGLDLVGLSLFVPVVRLASGEDPAGQIRALGTTIGIPLVAIAVFLIGWSLLASSIQTSIGSVPGPAAVWQEWNNLIDDHRAERHKEVEFQARMEKLKERFVAQGKPWKERRYSGKPTFFDQILTSLKTVFAGFLIASLVAVPIGILCGLSTRFYAAMNPLIQVFKPVSPLAWLPIVMILVSALYTT